MTIPEYDFANFIGRFRPASEAHRQIIVRGLASAKFVHVNVGSCFQPRTERSPFLYEEVREMILGAFSPAEKERILVSPVMDSPYNNTEWQTYIQDAMQDVFEAVGATSKPSVALIGHHKDFGTSFYLNMFPQWKSIAVENLHNNLSATQLRYHLFETGGWDDTFRDLVPSSTNAFLRDFCRTQDFRELMEEIRYYRKYREAHEEASDLIAKKLGYRTDIKHQTVDAMVVQSGHVLLIQRKTFPGRNLWALPGGFLDSDEWLEDATIRELREETKIKLPTPVIRGGYVTRMLADYPHRSSRGRVISDVSLFKLADGPLPKVKGRSDAKVAEWVPIADIRSENMFEDHFFVIQHLLAQL